MRVNKNQVMIAIVKMTIKRRQRRMALPLRDNALIPSAAAHAHTQMSKMRNP